MNNVFVDATNRHDEPTSTHTNNDYYPEDPYLEQLRHENDIFMKEIDNKINDQKMKIEKLNVKLNELIVLKEETESNFTKLLNEYIHSDKYKK